MRKDFLEKSIAEAKRFILAAEKVRAYSEECKQVSNHINGDKHTAGARRASMDLTRALADLRRNKWSNPK